MTEPSGGLPATTRLAVDRTRLALERTLMAWIRTGTSLISFGFTIYKFFQYLQESEKTRTDLADRMFGPREFALAMITSGVAAIIVGTLDYRRHVRQLEKEFGQMPSSWAFTLAWAISFLGAVGFFAALLRG
jgi:putative membrane protein